MARTTGQTNEWNDNPNKSTLDNSPPPNYDKESKVECHHVNNNARYKWYVKLAAFQVIAPTRSNYVRKINVKNRNKSTILIFLPAIIELVQELLISNMHNKLSVQHRHEIGGDICLTTLEKMETFDI